MLFFLIILFFVGMVLYKPGFKFFLIWIAFFSVIGFIDCGFAGVIGYDFWGLVLYSFYLEVDDTPSSNSTHSDKSPTNKTKIYPDGTRRTQNLSKTGYYYSNGEVSWTDTLGDEHRSNGEIIRDNAYIPGRRDIYNAKGEYIGYEYEDSTGITRRVNK